MTYKKLEPKVLSLKDVSKGKVKLLNLFSKNYPVSKRKIGKDFNIFIPTSKENPLDISLFITLSKLETV